MHQARRALIVSLAFSALYLYSGPVASGTAFLPPHGVTSNPFVAPGEHTPLHKGGVSLSSGIYVRENDDLILAGTPALVLRRTYISGYRASKQYVIGDGERFQWVSLIQANGSRVHFIRSSPGTSFFNARYRHSSTTGEWNGAELGWNWGQWVLRRRDGLAMSFQSCNSKTICSL